MIPITPNASATELAEAMAKACLALIPELHGAQYTLAAKGDNRQVTVNITVTSGSHAGHALRAICDLWSNDSRLDPDRCKVVSTYLLQTWHFDCFRVENGRAVVAEPTTHRW